MTMFGILALVGGLAMFLFGMNVLSSGLTRVSGGKLESSLQRLTSSNARAIILGLGTSAVIQSSSAVTVMLVGLVNSGIMTLKQSIGVIMGSNVGTTVTAWILSLTGIQGDNIFVNLLKPTSFSPVIAIAGIVLIMISKNNRKKEIGNIMVGFAILMFGMDMMGNAMTPLAESESFSRTLILFSNPLLGVIVGTVFTGIIQSSSASVGILQALTLTGTVTYGTALPIIMGQNIGTCVTALISSIGVTKNARRVAIVHVSFNIIGTVVFLSLFYLLNAFVHFPFLLEPADPLGIAVVHSFFNIFTTTLLLPFIGKLEKLAVMLVRDKGGSDESYELLDQRLLKNPAFAVEHCKTVTNKMAELVRDSIYATMSLMRAYDHQKARLIEEIEEKTDQYEDKLGTYLVSISSNALTLEDSRKVSMLLQNIGDFERIGDHSLNLLRSAQEMRMKKITFTEAAWEDIAIVADALTQIVNLTIDAFINEDIETARFVEPLEQVIDGLVFEMRSHHTLRLRDGVCTLETGFIFADLTNNFERISDHCSNIAACLIEVRKGHFDTHEYLRQVKNSSDVFFNENFEIFKKRYVLPSVDPEG
ncbi:MAG: Na/Pi cotransporter family protein [Clostridiales bacterium]|nr:Na/Pi cotransporter family protein [Clostridiales bacterium]